MNSDIMRLNAKIEIRTLQDRLTNKNHDMINSQIHAIVQSIESAIPPVIYRRGFESIARYLNQMIPDYYDIKID